MKPKRRFSVLRKVILGVLFFAIISSGSCVFARVTFDGRTTNVKLTDRSFILEDPNNNMTIREVRAADKSGLFQSIESKSLNLGYQKSVFWIKSTISNQSGTRRSMILEYHLERAGKKIEVYRSENGSEYNLIASTDRDKVSVTRPLSHRYIAFPVSFEAGETVTFYSSIENRTGLDLGLVLYDERSFSDAYKNDYIFFGAVSGIILILVLYNLALFVAFRDTGYISYVIFLVAFLFWHLTHEGVLFELFPSIDNHGKLVYFSAPLLMGMTMLQFGRSFLQLPVHSPNTNRYILLLITLIAANLVLCQLFDAGFFILTRNVILALAGLSIMLIGPYIYFKGYRPARYFALAVSLSTIPPILQIIDALDVINIGAQSSFGTAVAAIFMVSMFSLALLSRVNETRLEKEAAQERIIEVLTRTEELKNEFLANTSHELRTPLNGIIGIADSMMRGAAGQLTVPVRANLSLIVHSGKRLANLINDILDFSRLKNREMRLYLQPVSIRQITNLVIPFCQPLIKNGSVSLSNIIADDIPLVVGDEDRLQQILYNIIGNSVKFTDEGQITVSAELTGDMVKVTVSDTGIGIPEDHQADIFSEFIQVGASIRKNREGVGLGLPIAKQLVELHKGTITLFSEPGKGTNISFTLPVSKENAPPSRQLKGELLSSRLQEFPDVDTSIPTTEPTSVETGEGSLVLVVDDDQVNRTVVVNQLTVSNFQVMTASGGREALRQINADRVPDLMLLDLMMPDMTGFDVMAEVRKHHSGLDLPIIILSAKNRVIDFEQAIKAGANDYLTKPVNGEELLARLKLHDDFRLQNKELTRYRSHLEDLVNERTAELNRSLKTVERAKILAEQTNEAKTKFLSNIGHELRSPMQGILGFSQLGSSRIEKLDKEKLGDYFDSITKSGHRLLGLLNDLLDLSKMEAGKVNYYFQRYALPVIIKAVVTECQSLDVEKNISIKTDHLEYTDVVELDGERICQVLHNLLSNAIKFSPKDGTIQIASRLVNGNVAISVTDQGIGIPDSEVDLIFDRFEQSSRKKTGVIGTGLGLSICKEIIDGHNGQIWAENNLGGGAIFTFSIPLRQQAAA